MRARNIGLDILRILLALMVIAIHFNAPATGHVALAVTGKMKLLVLPMVAFCYPAVNTYVLISGFFSYKNKRSYDKILNSLIRLWLCLVFFQLLGYIISIVFMSESFNLLVLVKHFFPLSRGVWWYMTVYFVLMLISPALNLIIDKLTKKDFLRVITISLVICSIIPFFLQFESTIGMNQGSGIIWFIVLYLTGGGLSKFYLNDNVENKRRLCTLSAVSFFILTTYLLSSWKIHAVIGLDGYNSYMYNSIIVYGQALSLFLFFWGIEIKKDTVSKTISFFAGLSLAAYIFHCQEDIGRFIWQLSEPAKYANSIKLVPLFIIVVFGVYFISIILEFLRKQLFSIRGIEKKMVFYMSKLFNGALNKVCHCLNKE